jgi:hypothetical protein
MIHATYILKLNSEALILSKFLQNKNKKYSKKNMTFSLSFFPSPSLMSTHQAPVHVDQLFLKSREEL